MANCYLFSFGPLGLRFGPSFKSLIIHMIQDCRFPGVSPQHLGLEKAVSAVVYLATQANPVVLIGEDADKQIWGPVGEARNNREDDYSALTYKYSAEYDLRVLGGDSNSNLRYKNYRSSRVILSARRSTMSSYK